VSLTVTASGRNVRPVATAFAMLVRSTNPDADAGSSQSGMSLKASTLWSLRKPASAQVNRTSVSPLRAARIP
jgi:hypothetical protein